MRQLTLGVQLKERATFASFLTARNVELVAHLQHVAATHAAGATWLAGPHTAGKSHLLQAVCAARRRPETRRLSAARIAAAVRPGRARRRRTLDVACYDDVQAIAGLDDWERRLFSLWQRAQERNTTLLFAARENPAQVRIRPRGPEIAAGVIRRVRGARAQRRGADRGAEPARAPARVRAAGGNRALSAAPLSARHAHACAKSSIRSTTRRSPRSGASRCRSSATSIDGRSQA